MISDTKSKSSKTTEGSLVPRDAQNKGSWSCFSLMFCCPTRDEDPDQIKKSGITSARGTTHYSADQNSTLNSALKKRNTIQRIAANNATMFYPKDTAFILRKGFKKIISKICKFDLNKKTLAVVENKLGRESPASSVYVGSLAQSGSYEFTRHEIFSLYNKGIQIDKDDWNEVTPEFIAQHIAKKLKGKIIIDALCGYGGNAIQVYLDSIHMVLLNYLR